MDEEQVSLIKKQSLQSPKQSSVRSQDYSSSLRQSSKSESPKASIIRTSPLVTSPSSLTKSSVHLSMKSGGSSKDRSIQPTQAEDKSLESLNSSRDIVEIKKSLVTPEMPAKISDRSDDIKDTLLNMENEKDSVLQSNIDKISYMSKTITNEANALRQSIKSLSEDIVRTKQELSIVKEEDINFPYHLFLVEIIVNKIHMKCDCFELDCNNLVIAATFLGKQPITLYDSSYGEIEDFSNLNVGKSALFAMTYDKICNIKEFLLNINLSKQPPCSSCVTKIAETKVDCTKEFVGLREELCNKWTEEQPNDNIMCTTSTPLTRNMFYLSCGETTHRDAIGIIELTTRMSFLGKEITTAFSSTSKAKCTSVLMKEDNGMSMYACQNVEMDRQGKIILDESSLSKKEVPKNTYTISPRGFESPVSQYSSKHGSNKQYLNYNNHIRKYREEEIPRYDEIFTKMNANELKIKVPKSTKVERMGRYDKIQELCSCEDTPYNAGDQIQFELPSDVCNPGKSHNTYSSNFKYTYKGCDRSCDNRDRKIINVTPSNCPAPINMEKQVHPQKDVFILKIGKKLESKDKKTDLEIELVTPKAPNERPNQNNHISQQCSSSTLKDKPSKSEKKKDKKKTKLSKSNTYKKTKKDKKIKKTKK